MGKQNPGDEFNVQAITQKIERLSRIGDHEGMIQEIKRPWPGMDGDIRLAVQELMSELMRNGRVPLYLKDLEMDDETETISIQLPDWIHAANQAFQQRYPDADEAGLRFQKTMAVLQFRLMDSNATDGEGFENLVSVLKEWLPDWPPGPTRIH